MEIKTITKEQLKQWLDAHEDVLLVDVLPPEQYAQEHIPGAQNAPVYEMAFLEHVAKLTGDRGRHIVLYNEDPRSLAAEDAANKLMRAGYSHVEIFPGGLTEWKHAGWEIEGSRQGGVVAPKEGRHELDIAASLVRWTGRNAKYAHHGAIALKHGYITIENGELTAGEFVLDMPTVKDEDIADEAMRAILETHLRSSDFFDIEHFPEAHFTITHVERIERASIGQSNHVIRGTLQIKDVSNDIEFPAMIVPMDDGSINGQAHFDIDRTAWNVRYGSEKFFEKLGMHLVNDAISLELFLVAKA